MDKIDLYHQVLWTFESILHGEKIPIGYWGKVFFGFLTTNFRPFFSAVSSGLTWFLETLSAILLWFPPLVIVIAVAALAIIIAVGC